MIQPIVCVVLLNVLLCMSCLAADSKRSYLTRVFRLDEGRKREDISTKKEGKHESKASFSLEAFNKRWILDVKQNRDIHTPRVLLRTFDEDDKLTQKRHVPESCYYQGSIRDVANSAVVLNTCDGLSGYIQDGPEEFEIDPVPNDVEDNHKVTKVLKDDPFSPENIIKGCGVKHDSTSEEHVHDHVHSEREDSSFNVHPKETESQYQERIGRRLVHLEKAYIPYLTTNETRYLELFLVTDNVIYQRLNNDTNLVLQRVLALANMVDRVFSAINIRIVLVGLEVWSNGDRIARSADSGTDLSNYGSYYRKHIRSLTSIDASHFLSHRGWNGGVIGLAWIPAVCGGTPTAVDLFQTHKVTGTHNVFAHELGHNLNMGHDAATCKCLSLNGGCILGGGACKRCGFSNCSMKTFGSRSWKCLNNYPKTTLVPQCGNGIVDKGEECDCGSPQMCKKKDPCCQPYNCILKREAQCSDISTPDCCKDCLFKRHGTMCRETSTSGCDVPEYCTGNSPTCPADTYMKDGTPCSENIQILSANGNGKTVQTSIFQPAIEARYVRVNPRLSKPNHDHCMRLEVLTCPTTQASPYSPTPIATRDLYSQPSLVLSSELINCNYSGDTYLAYKRLPLSDCEAPHVKFVLQPNGALKHHCSGKLVCPMADGKTLHISNTCTVENSKFVRTKGSSLKHVKTGLCINSFDNSPHAGDFAKLNENCDSSDNRNRLDFLVQDCMLPAGLESGILPDSSITSNSKKKEDAARFGRLWTGGGVLSWCAEKRGSKDSYIQIDLGKVKKVGGLKTQGWVTAYWLFYSDDGIHWKGYNKGGKKAETNSNCYAGNCMLSRNTQCLRLWDKGVADTSLCKGTTRGKGYRGTISTTVSGRTCQNWTSKTPHSHSVKADASWKNYCRNPDWEPAPWCYTMDKNKRWELCSIPMCGGARSANETCWKKLNMEAKGYGTCDPRSNQSCAQKDIYCGQLQCFSEYKSPGKNYGSNYHRIDLGGKDHCRAASITMTPSDELGLGMVSEGTKCGPGKMCSSFQCKSISELNVKGCPKSNGAECAGNGVCTNEGKCHCFRGYDPSGGCQNLLQPKDGGYGSWSLWTKCTKPCDTGRRRRHRYCNNPLPANGGKDCQGHKTVEEDCNIQSCPHSGSCKQLMNSMKSKGKHVADGIYTIYPDGVTPVKTYCDMVRHGGGWTLLVASHTNKWTPEKVLLNNADNPQLHEDYSILKYADQIKDNYLIKDNYFEYRLEAERFGRFGGIWRAPSLYSFVAKTTNQTGVKLTKKFDEWYYKKWGLRERMPYIYKARLTTSNDAVRDNYGSITDNNPSIYPAHWMSGNMMMDRPESIWYWMREGDLEIPKSCLEILHRSANGHWNPSGKYVINTSSYKRVSAYCDMDSFGGGWTLLLNKASSKGWTKDNVIKRNIMDASLSSDYSIFGVGNEMKIRIPDEDTFQYMVEANGRLSNGGVFKAHKSVDLLKDQNDGLTPFLLQRFGNWSSESNNLAKRVPYITNKFGIYLTTSSSIPSDTSGSIISNDNTQADYLSELQKPTVIRIWLRETGSRKSCNDIKIHGEHTGISNYKDGVYFVQGNGAKIIPVYCDMTSNASAWTLILTSASYNWTESQVLSRNERHPSIASDYSILHLADKIRDLSGIKTFKYKIEAIERGHWGGIFEAPKDYTFTKRNNQQTNVKLLVQFDSGKWTYNKYNTLQNRMPYIGNYKKRKGLLTTSASDSYSWYGTLVSSGTEYNPAPYMDTGPALNPGIIWYWINEDDCGPQRKAVNGKISPWSTWGHCCKGSQKRTRYIMLPRCGGWPFLKSFLRPEDKMEEARKCTNTTYCLECKENQMGSNYRGTSTKTKNGLTCQAWTSQSPHNHNRTPNRYPGKDLNNNYCRNPDGETRGPWCYTITSTRWEYCNIKICDACCQK